MRTFFIFLCCIFSATTIHAACNSNIPASTPDSQLIDNGNGTVTDSKTGLMWKKCLEGVSGDNCETNSPSAFTWQVALQRIGAVNSAGGFAGYTDWRLPNIRELRSIVEEQCSNPAINTTRFPRTPSGFVWSGSPVTGIDSSSWYVYFYNGSSPRTNRSNNTFAVRLVRGGQ